MSVFGIVCVLVGLVALYGALFDADQLGRPGVKSYRPRERPWAAALGLGFLVYGLALLL